jgi:hypothetical protein
MNLFALLVFFPGVVLSALDFKIAIAAALSFSLLPSPMCSYTTFCMHQNVFLSVGPLDLMLNIFSAWRCVCIQ